jgi:hypothetical protein
MNEEFTKFNGATGIRTDANTTGYDLYYMDGDDTANVGACDWDNEEAISMTVDELREFIADLVGVLNRMNLTQERP